MKRTSKEAMDLAEEIFSKVMKKEKQKSEEWGLFIKVSSVFKATLVVDCEDCETREIIKNKFSSAFEKVAQVIPLYHEVEPNYFCLNFEYNETQLSEADDLIISLCKYFKGECYGYDHHWSVRSYLKNIDTQEIEIFTSGVKTQDVGEQKKVRHTLLCMDFFYPLKVPSELQYFLPRDVSYTDLMTINFPQQY